jgi:hypothetical protein
VALLDWSNALVGEAPLDLARAAEYGSLTAPVLAAYGATDAFSLTPRTPREMIYRLDTAVMLSHVFLDGAPDAAKAQSTTSTARGLSARRSSATEHGSRITRRPGHTRGDGFGNECSISDQ